MSAEPDGNCAATIYAFARMRRNIPNGLSLKSDKRVKAARRMRVRLLNHRWNAEMAYGGRRGQSVHARAGGLDHLRPLYRFGCHEGCELLRRAADGFRANLGEALFDFVALQNFHRLSA